MARYIYQHTDWPHFFWDQDKLAPLLAKVHLRQGRLLGSLQALGFDIQHETVLNSLALEVTQSSDIEGEILNLQQVRSSIARRLGFDIGNLKTASQNVEGAVEIVFDAIQNFNEPLTEERLCHWHLALMSGDKRWHLTVGSWRTDAHGPMQIVSDAIGKERVHFEAPAAEMLHKEMSVFIEWANRKNDIDPLLKAAIAHFWFVTLHPFDDGNGRIARAITDWLLARHEQSILRFYSMSAQIRLERKAYYAILEKTSKGGLEITPYLEWFLQTLDHAFDRTEYMVHVALMKAKFWHEYETIHFNSRQKLVINTLFDGFFGKLTTHKWSKMMKCSQDTALRDINALIEMDILQKDPEGGRFTGYSLVSRWNITPLAMP